MIISLISVVFAPACTFPAAHVYKLPLTNEILQRTNVTEIDVGGAGSGVARYVVSLKLLNIS